MIFELGLIGTAIIAGGVASVTGFGIGSLITPSLGTKLAVAVVSVPHFIATAIRFWMLRYYLDKRILIRFGLMSAAGGLIGAWIAESLGL
jgi:uncharacterized membrane protein YfcA